MAVLDNLNNVVAIAASVVTVLATVSALVTGRRDARCAASESEGPTESVVQTQTVKGDGNTLTQTVNQDQRTYNTTVKNEGLPCVQGEDSWDDVVGKGIGCLLFVAVSLSLLALYGLYALWFTRLLLGLMLLLVGLAAAAPALRSHCRFSRKGLVSSVAVTLCVLAATWVLEVSTVQKQLSAAVTVGRGFGSYIAQVMGLPHEVTVLAFASYVLVGVGAMAAFMSLWFTLRSAAAGTDGSVGRPMVGLSACGIAFAALSVVAGTDWAIGVLGPCFNPIVMS